MSSVKVKRLLRPCVFLFDIVSKRNNCVMRNQMTKTKKTKKKRKSKRQKEKEN